MATEKVRLLQKKVQIPAPKHLSARCKRVWSRITSDYELEEHHQQLLRLACEAMDRCEQARLLLAREGLTVMSRDGASKAHPAAAIERDARLAVARLLRELNIDGALEEELRAPRIGGAKGRR